MPQICECNKRFIHDQNPNSSLSDSAPSHHMSDHKSTLGHRFGGVEASPLRFTPAKNARKRQYVSE